MNNKNNLKIAKRYAQSLISIMINNDFNKNEIIENLKNVKIILNSSNELYNAMTNPIISANDKKSIINSIFKNETNETICNFLKLLIEKNRFNLIFSIIDEFIKIINKMNNIVNINIISAIELEQNRKEQIKNKLSEKLNGNIEIKYDIDNSIIAGLIFKIEDNVLDTSFKRKIQDLKEELV